MNNMKLPLCLFLFSFSLAIAGCGGVPADVYPKTVGTFTLKDAPTAGRDGKRNRVYYGMYVSGDKKIRCDATDFPSPNDAIGFVRDTEVVAMDGETKTVAGENGGYRVLGYAPLATVNEKDRIWDLRWSTASRAYSCDAEGIESDNAAVLRDFEKAWQSTKK